jgi:glycosyltransferase involved in cell wall biosynthesis
MVLRVVAEGSASGLAVIASDRGALREMVGPFGIVTHPTVEHFTCYIKNYIKFRNELRTHQLRSRLFALKYYSRKNAEVMTKEYDI